MTQPNPLPATFYDRPAPEVARALLGMNLVRDWRGERLSGRIVETEAYSGEDDRACHARSGKTARNAAMYGPPGHAYIYFTYGMHWCLNAVCASPGFPAAVLIRALQPQEGLETIARHRAGIDPSHWCDGPAKLCSALAITGALNTISLTAPSELWIEPPEQPLQFEIEAGPRVGIAYAEEPWRSIPWRFRL